MVDFDTIGLPPGALIGMIHVGALPGTPASRRSVSHLAGDAVEEARRLASAGFDAILIENMHDRPYLKDGVGPEIVASMARIVAEVGNAVSRPVGVQILAGANNEALAAAHASGARFIRAENFTFAAVADEGLMATASAGSLLRYRRAIGADSIAILADVKKKHSSHSITSDVPFVDAIHAAEFFQADAVVVTGAATGRPVSPEHLESARRASNLPVVVGSGADADSVGALLEHAHAVIVGSSIKEEGDWRRPVDAARAEAFVQAARESARD